MDERVQPILARGQYRVALPPGGHDHDQAPLVPHAYLVLDASGRWLRTESTLEMALDWIDQRIRDEQELDQLARELEHPPGPDPSITPTRSAPRARPRRPRR